MKYLIALAYLATILVANYVTTEFGMVPVGFGLVATAGTYLIGAAFILRDSLQDYAGKGGAIAIMLLGTLLSFLLADPFIALASASAFLLSETSDLLIYTPLRKRGYVRAAVASNAVSSVVDTVAFLAIAGFPVLAALPGQMVGKLSVTAAVVFLVWVVRHSRKVVAEIHA